MFMLAINIPSVGNCLSLFTFSTVTLDICTGKSMVWHCTKYCIPWDPSLQILYSATMVSTEDLTILYGQFGETFDKKCSSCYSLHPHTIQGQIFHSKDKEELCWIGVLHNMCKNLQPASIPTYLENYPEVKVIGKVFNSNGTLSAMVIPSCSRFS